MNGDISVKSKVPPSAHFIHSFLLLTNYIIHKINLHTLATMKSRCSESHNLLYSLLRCLATALLFSKFNHTPKKQVWAQIF